MKLPAKLVIHKDRAVKFPNANFAFGANDFNNYENYAFIPRTGGSVG